MESASLDAKGRGMTVCLYVLLLLLCVCVLFALCCVLCGSEALRQINRLVLLDSFLLLFLLKGLFT